MLSMRSFAIEKKIKFAMEFISTKSKLESRDKQTWTLKSGPTSCSPKQIRIWGFLNAPMNPTQTDKGFLIPSPKSSWVR